MIAAPVAASWDALDELEALPTPSKASKVSPPPAPPIPASCTLQSVICTLYSILQIKEGDTVTAPMRVRALSRLKEKEPYLVDLFSKQVAVRMNVEPSKRKEALTALIPHLFRAVSGVVAEQLAAVDWLLNQGVYNTPMQDHLTEQKALWDVCDQRYLEELAATEREVYDALDTDDKDAFRIMRDLAMHGGGTFFMGCDQLEHRLGTGCNGWRLLNRFGTGEYGIIAKVEDGRKWEKGARPKAASYRWELPLPAQVDAVAA